ncbi:MAG TPA: cation diffusion facilitator family transporter [Caldilineaceae bacterium]|nr:cation diffusion facilitator family transporter [Caldilineaceae bacterium]
MANSATPHTHSHEEGHDEEHNHPHSHDHEHAHEPHGAHDHHHGTGLWGWINTVFHLHGHSDQQLQRAVDPALADNTEGIRTVWIALGALGFTTILQIVIVYMSGSVALFADTVHNLGDSLNSIPLLIAFYLARRAATRRYTYGFGKAEDVAGIFIVLSIAFSAGVALWQSFAKLINPAPMTDLGWVAAAAIIGFIGNEAVAILQIRVGRKIGSAAMIADGLHARTDGLTSLAVLVAVIGTYFGFPILDPIIGLLIGVAIIFITWDATRTMWYRLMDAIDPEVVDRVEQIAYGVPGVLDVHDTRVRWHGHRLQVALHVIVNEDLPTRESHRIAEEVRHMLFHDQPHLSLVNIHVDPCGHGGAEPHNRMAHHAVSSTRQTQPA